jgi:sugar O-acyltransferase (sialic acid O-acetyltransferase NeuD family)
VNGVVLFAAGSPIVVEYAETCARLGRTIAAVVRNRDVPVFFPDATKIVGVRGITDAMRSQPCFCPLFTPANRRTATDEALELGLAFTEALIDPTAIVASSTAIGAGTFVNAGAIVGAAAVIGDHVVLNRGASIGHHAELAEFASVGPSAVLGGNVRVGRGATIGAGAVVLPGVEVGAHAIVGAGAVVVADVPARTKAFGNPARTRESGLAGF